VSIGPNTETGLPTATLTVPNLTDPAGTWVGATIHIAPGSQWVWQTGTVIASGPGQLTFSYQPLTPYSYQIPTLGNPFYLTGAPAALDAPGEWTINPASHVLSLIPSDGNTPAAGAVEVKQRLYGFDLSGLSYINISNLNFFACTINTSAASTHITINNITARYVSNDFNKPDPWADQYLPHTSGIILNGTNNLLENSIINYSSCDGVYLGGSNNTVRNCSVSNADYAGADEAGITTSGANEQVLFNTVYNCGRNGIDIRYSPAASILNNRIYNVGLLTTDMGGIYTFNTDGQETVIANNLISDIHAGGFGGAGIHLDNGSSSYIVHNNVVWNADTALKMNPPSQNNVIVNNTFIGTLASIDGNGSTGMTGSMLVNNIFIGPVGTVGADLTESNDLFNDASVKFVNPPKNDFRLLRGSAGIHTGRALPPYAVTIGKFPPDIGAYAYGKKPFTNGARIAPPLNRLFLRL
jgi:parallel beta-helix repeat protein